jgi:hypothetical protein
MMSIDYSKGTVKTKVYSKSENVWRGRRKWSGIKEEEWPCP